MHDHHAVVSSCPTTSHTGTDQTRPDNENRARLRCAMANLIPQNKPLKEHDPVLYDLIQQ